jgi:diguanylate cyclase (GGDEF)-like protein
VTEGAGSAAMWPAVAAALRGAKECGVAVIDGAGARIVHCAGTAVELFGGHVDRLANPRLAAVLEAAGDGLLFEGVMTFLRPSGRYTSVRGTVARVDGVVAVVLEPLAPRRDDALQILSDMVRASATRERALSRRNLLAGQRVLSMKRDLDDAEASARLDPSTGLTSRRFGEVSLDAALSEAEWSGAPVSVAMIDIDAFKQVNDTYGHAVGDRVLQHTAAQLLSVCRAGDVAARWGGDELLLVLPGADLDGAAVVLQRFRDRLAGSGGGLPSVTITGGVACFARGDDGAALLARADAALYRGKVKGRDRIVVDGQEESNEFE